MRRRSPEAVEGGLPREIAAGPVSFDRDDVAAWFAAGREWSLANGHSWNGWQRLLSAEVRRSTTRRRLRNG